MRYNLAAVYGLCREVGLSANSVTNERIEIDLGSGAVLYVQNADREEDCLIGFLGTAWHFHGNTIFADARGNYVELGYLDLLKNLVGGQVLICEFQAGGRTIDRSLIHSQYHDEYTHLQIGEQLVVRRAVVDRVDAES